MKHPVEAIHMSRFRDSITGEEVSAEEMFVALTKHVNEGRKIIFAFSYPVGIGHVVDFGGMPMAAIRESTREEYMQQSSHGLPPRNGREFFYEMAMD